MKNKMWVIAILAVTGFATISCGKDSSPGIEMVQIAGGSFEMGKNLGTVDGGDIAEVHTVTLSGFSMSKYEVTQKQWEAVMGTNPSFHNASPAQGESQGNRPVERVSWYDALVFCNKLSMKEKLTPAYRIAGSTNPGDWGEVPETNDLTWNAVEIVSGSTGYRLPTEAQWEYAAKGGNQGTAGWTAYTYAGSNTVDDVAWFTDNTGITREVGKKAPNGLGLYDMSGNVWEWCWDRYETYSSEAQTDPTGAASGMMFRSTRVARGGGWCNQADYVRSVYRYAYFPLFGRNAELGFRLVRPEA